MDCVGLRASNVLQQRLCRALRLLGTMKASVPKSFQGFRTPAVDKIRLLPEFAASWYMPVTKDSQCASVRSTRCLSIGPESEFEIQSI